MEAPDLVNGPANGLEATDIKRKADDIPDAPAKKQKIASEDVDPKGSDEGNPATPQTGAVPAANGASTAHSTQAETTSTTTPTTDQPLSRSAAKKLAKRQAWEEGRDARKAKRKQKTQERKERKRAQRDLVASDPGIPPAPKRPRSVQVPVTFIVDCQFDSYMTENEMISMGSQLTRCYSDNRRATYRVHLAVSGFEGRLKERFEGILKNMHKNWHGVKFRSEAFISVAQEAKGWMSDKRNRVAGALAKDVDGNASDAKEDDEADEDEEHGSDVLGSPEEQDAKMREEEFESDQPAPNGTQEHAHLEVPAARSSQDPTKPLQDDLVPTTPDNDNRPPLPLPQSTPLPEGEIVYLSSDSDNTLFELKPNSTYIIGGIVDKNRHKGLCHRIALENNVKTAKLPIGDYLKMQSRTVLTTNHVNEIMLKWLECGDWGEAFMSVMPKRKEASLKEKEKEEAERDAKAAGDSGVKVADEDERNETFSTNGEQGTSGAEAEEGS